MSKLTQRIAKLSLEKRQQLERRLLAKHNDQPKQSIPHRTDEHSAPLSFAQERLWILAQLEPASPAYNEVRAIRITGPLDLNVLKQSLAALTARHDNLRVCFRSVDNVMQQVVVSSQKTLMPLIDLSDDPPDILDGQDAVWEIIEAEGNKIFDLTEPPLWRVCIVRLAEDDYIFVLVYHHIISDGWSTEILWRELRHFYSKFSNRPIQNPLPQLPIAYRDFAVWQRQNLQGDRLENLVNYWRTKLGNLQPLDLPTDYVRPQQPSYRGKAEYFDLDQTLVTPLSALAQSTNTSLYMVLLTAFQVLLYRYSGQTDIAVGSPIANRQYPELEDIYGFFTNTLVMRTNCSDNPTFDLLLAQVRKTTLDAYQHQDLPFEKLVDELNPERVLNRNPLFDVLFSVQNTPQADWQLPGLKTQHLAPPGISSKFDLSLLLYHTDLGLAGRLEYATDLFELSTIRRMIEHFRTLLNGIITDPSQPIAELPILTDLERHQLLIQWNDTQTPYPQDLCVHHLFEAQAERTPDATAVCFEQQELSYRELNLRANQLAHDLIALGIGPDTLVGICLSRSLEMVIGVLAILKAGGAYVPLDPAYPKARLAFILKDTQAPLLLTEAAYKPIFQQYAGQTYLLNNVTSLAREGNSTENPTYTGTRANLGYAIYTSGSTGEPKGIALPHRALTNLIQWQLGQITLPGHNRQLQYSSLNFDASFVDIFMALCAGDTLSIISEDIKLDPKSLTEFIEQEGITRINLPIVVLQQIAEVALQRAYDFKLTEVSSTAEQMQITPAIVALFRQLPECRVQNHYGPSETHAVTAFTLNDVPKQWPQFPPIGRPISNTQTYILDEYLQLVPIGVTGELYIGGDCLARGYLNRPALTAEKFIPHPFRDEVDARLYKTGDLACYLPDGNIKFLGRKDNQVKIRGFRIELGEIEAALRKHPSIQQSAVLDKKTDDQTYLVVYIVADTDLNVSELRRFLSESLPLYMLPKAFIQLDHLPLTPNGKLDRNALPEADTLRPALENQFVPPQTPTEAKLVEIWQQLLKIKQVGVQDNFFELGGHSLIATQLVSRIRDTFQVEFLLRTIFETPIISSLGQQIDTLLWLSKPDTFDEETRGEEGEL